MGGRGGLTILGRRQVCEGHGHRPRFGGEFVGRRIVGRRLALLFDGLLHLQAGRSANEIGCSGPVQKGRRGAVPTGSEKTYWPAEDGDTTLSVAEYSLSAFLSENSHSLA